MMLKKGIMLIMLGLMFSSCDFIHYGKIAVYENTNRIERERETKEARKKDGPFAVVVDEYKEGVKEVIEDILKRPINKKVQFEGITLIIPEGTRINSKLGNIVDEKTGYGITIMFSLKKRYYITKEVNNKKYGFFYDEYDVNISKIAQRIMKINDFKEPK
ncbi:MULTISPECIES: hypothetical protein [Fusobacterium]|uniref:Lipoprotein n=3 Tax=Fusobacterium TaxID=848 RepID=A0AAD0HVQ7_9FUSO|nr:MULTISPECIES: hypothetical protein [Fusobacterium]ATV69250.1 hypothetical protein CTM98_00235 [Fusobacterium pseudoperiodonticum]AVQ25770.1 hypothetical protein C4N17_08885 [Fusobacterium periodonticum]KGE61868.1 hypothetical protein FSAG_003114 [Fusobacterium periodonticum 2_1_31]